MIILSMTDRKRSGTPIMINNLVYNGAGIAFTSQHEGRRYVAYQDSGGVWTCGDGHTDGVGPSTTCDDALADEWLIQDTQMASNAVNNLVSVPLTQNEFNALVDFTFNCGIHAFSQSTMLILLNSGDYAGAALQFERWDLCDGKVVAGLLNRRKDEETEFDSSSGV